MDACDHVRLPSERLLFWDFAFVAPDDVSLQECFHGAFARLVCVVHAPIRGLDGASEPLEIDAYVRLRLYNLIDAEAALLIVYRFV